MRTLHLYFARELLKTFLMTSLALTLLVVMGGGVANIFKGEGIGAEDVAKVFAFLTPVAITLILPVAALFSATICYGRAAADNEVIACRAAGINIHRLLLSAGVLGLSVTAFTYCSWNFLIPRLLQQIEDTTRQELHTIVQSQFQKAKPLSFGKYRIMANRCETLTPDRLPSDVSPNHTFLLLTGVSFIELDDQEVARFGTADTTTLDFDREELTPRVRASLEGVRAYDSTRKQQYETKHQVIGPYPIPVPVRRKIKFENLPALLRYQEHPETIPDIDSRMGNMRRIVMAFVLYDDIAAQLDPDRHGQGKYVLQSEAVHYEIAVDAFKLDPEDGRPTLGGVRVEEKSLTDGSRRIYSADTATLELRSGIKPGTFIVMPLLKGNVGARRVPHVEGERIVKKDTSELLPVEFMAQPSLKAKFDSISVPGLLTGEQHMDLPPDQSRQIAKLAERIIQFEGEVRSEIHFRASYAISVVAMVLLGATLGIVVRGGQVLTAFGISCVPVLIVVVACIVGRNLADRPQYAAMSMGVMWGATGFMYIAFGYVATKVLRR
ncbi:MAG: LptF/LptG family permease [Planctomycetota bacterium]